MDFQMRFFERVSMRSAG